MEASALILMILFIIVIWGGLAVSVTLLTRTDDDTCGDLGDYPGTDDDSLMKHPM
ncbi:methionine/alanine import NSS transporter subunit MetS [Corynebacterium sp. 320]|uniref:Methionine/alanine import NSS transporter subunit MetS n=1 Tax=Corynebacterium zhongnanshanii TaxID=2768834 RepID=A0ABQ6VFF0_9CORY|nr:MULTISPECIES: methionine/alanine import NSS transporter subunit MetS [Corynebacterium]KAB1504012.1 methionine/alanine import NSS transporter subunit MetS [Corynebacterium sp. 320]KAB1552889.1 methionine/alanine import NSS transporter subunit MetS [Corynebacterium sp. 321]KAB1553893.1 methionine/alanine import NSS transporter subunit MetS [Corynebacterium sp. 319]KAB3523139.1 methionine/alanine import NSS transporter subunit MetS [Corynebacterium zhongnanshanii]KAB3528148.1 methionine/alanin